MKIHAIFSQLGFAEAAAHVDLPDQATLCAVEQYFVLQQGLVWQNMADKFAAEGLDPTEEDQLRIKHGIEEARDIRQCMEAKQIALMQEHADQLMQAELDFVRLVIMHIALCWSAVASVTYQQTACKLISIGAISW